VDVINEWGDSGVYNENSLIDNFMMRKVLTLAGTEYKAVAFDFAQARLRREDEFEREWREQKYRRDEEGAVLAVIPGTGGLDLGDDYS
jgi:hypothetical protein